MERKIGEVFVCQGHKMITMEQPMGYGCRGCYFNGAGLSCLNTNTGSCSMTHRTDGISVIFKLLK